jgi:peptidyl-prolyl cis-trans isomerase A (cyclophilin A)
VNESGNGLTNQRGTVGLARPPGPHDGDVQFYVNLATTPRSIRIRPAGAMRSSARSCKAWRWSIRSAIVPTGAKGPFKENAPLKPVVIEKIERVGPRP